MPATLLSLIPLVASLLSFHDTAHADCEPATCGNLTVKYPFWLGGANQTSSPCGHPAFQVWCGGSGSLATLSGTAINVLGVDYGNNSLVASHSRIAAANGVCRTDFNLSVSIALSPFKFSRRNRALCFLYGCNGTEPRGPRYVNATSNCSAPIYAYLAGGYDRDFPPAIGATGRCKYAYFPVLGTEAANTTKANYSRLLKDGFILEWQTVLVGDCPACVASGGQCRYDNNAATFACLCPQGKRRKGSACATGESPPNSTCPTYTATLLSLCRVDARRRPNRYMHLSTSCKRLSRSVVASFGAAWHTGGVWIRFLAA
jgi:hypothetical protein